MSDQIVTLGGPERDGAGRGGGRLRRWIRGRPGGGAGGRAGGRVLVVLVALAVVADLIVMHVLARNGSTHGHGRHPPARPTAPAYPEYPGALVARLPLSGVVGVVGVAGVAGGPGAPGVAGRGARAWVLRAVPSGPAGQGVAYEADEVDVATGAVLARLGPGVLGRSPGGTGNGGGQADGAGPGAAAAPAVAVGGGSVWLTTAHGRSQGQVVRADPVSGRVITRLHLPAGRCSWLGYAAGSLLAECAAAGSQASSFLRVDPATGRTTWRSGLIRGQVGVIVATPTTVWYSTPPTQITGLRVAAGRRVPAVRHKLGSDFLAQIQSLVYGGGALWALTSDESITEIDPADGRVLRRFTYRDYDPQRLGGLDYLAFGHGSLWLLDDGYPFSGVLRVSAVTGRPLAWAPGVAPGACGAQPCAGIYVTAGQVWVPTAVSLLRFDPGRMPGRDGACAKRCPTRATASRVP